MKHSSIDRSHHPVMDETEAAEFIGVCGRTLRNIRKRKQIPYARAGGRVLYVRSQLLEWLEAGGTNQSEVSKEDGLPTAE